MSEDYSQELLDLLLLTVLTTFERYQEEWLERHDDIKLSKAEREMISKFLRESNKTFVKEYIESGVLRGEAIEEETEE